MTLPIKDFFSKYDQICGLGHIYEKLSSMKNFIFCKVLKGYIYFLW